MELEVLKALGDETRFAMYRELATSTTPLSALRNAVPGSEMGQTLWIIGMVFFIALITKEVAEAKAALVAALKWSDEFVGVDMTQRPDARFAEDDRQSRVE